jgi:hypothetical protein
MNKTYEILEERIPQSIPLTSRIVDAKARVDEIHIKIAGLIRARAVAASHLDRLLAQNAKTLENEVRTGTRSIHSEDFFGPNITGFENSPMGKK